MLLDLVEEAFGAVVTLESPKSLPRKLLLKNWMSPGDVVMLTAAVRDLHFACPGRFAMDVRTTGSQLWEHNPYLTPLNESDPEVQVIECEYPLINSSNTAPFHFVHGFTQFLNQRLGLSIQPTTFNGDIHLSALEKSWFSQVHEITGEDTPFWIIVAGGKYDYTAKWWEVRRYQEVVDHFQGRIQFVQVGESGHFHPRLRGVIDLRGKTDLRQLVRLVYHSQGVVCPVTSLMHLAAAIEVKGDRRKNRPCVVIAGGREPVHWEAYPWHQFLHTMGALRCCANGGCWKSRTVPLGDGDSKDRPENLCVDAVPLNPWQSDGNESQDGDQRRWGKAATALPRCMDMISTADVVRAIERYFYGGAVRFLTRRQARAAALALASR